MFLQIYRLVSTGMLLYKQGMANVHQIYFSSDHITDEFSPRNDPLNGLSVGSLSNYVIIIDAGSSDGTVEVIKSFGDKISYFIYNSEMYQLLYL